MKINNIYGVDPPNRLNKQSVDGVRDKKKAEKKDDSGASRVSSSSAKTDQVQISHEGQALQRSDNEIGLSKELLNKLPNARAHVVYDAIAKIKAGLYSNDEIVESAAQKMLQSGELNDVVKF